MYTHARAARRRFFFSLFSEILSLSQFFIRVSNDQRPTTLKMASFAPAATRRCNPDGIPYFVPRIFVFDTFPMDGDFILCKDDIVTAVNSCLSCLDTECWSFRPTKGQDVTWDAIYVTPFSKLISDTPRLVTHVHVRIKVVYDTTNDRFLLEIHSVQGHGFPLHDVVRLLKEALAPPEQKPSSNNQPISPADTEMPLPHITLTPKNEHEELILKRMEESEDYEYHFSAGYNNQPIVLDTGVRPDRTPVKNEHEALLLKQILESEDYEPDEIYKPL